MKKDLEFKRFILSMSSILIISSFAFLTDMDIKKVYGTYSSDQTLEFEINDKYDEQGKSSVISLERLEEIERLEKDAELIELIRPVLEKHLNDEKERIEKEKLEQERIEKEKLEQERIEKEKLEQERIEKEKLEQERIEKERIEQERIEKERIEQERKERIEKMEKNLKKDEVALLYTSSTKSCMDYRKITSKSSSQYKFINESGIIHVDDEGFLRDNDDFIGVALGSYFGEIGNRFIFELETGKKIKVIKVEEKSDNDTIDGFIHASDNSIIEFVCDFSKMEDKKADNNYPYNGNFNNAEEFNGEIRAIYRVY